MTPTGGEACCAAVSPAGEKGADSMSQSAEASPPSGRRPTLRDVAARAEVSFKTVSRVVNNESGVSPALAERVRRAIEELDFRPNAGASSLRRADRRTLSIGLLLEDVANPHSAALQRAVEDAATPRGMIVFSGSLDEDPARERALIRAFSARRADGLVVAPTATTRRTWPARCGPEPRSSAWTGRHATSRSTR